MESRIVAMLNVRYPNIPTNRVNDSNLGQYEILRTGNIITFVNIFKKLMTKDMNICLQYALEENVEHTIFVFQGATPNISKLIGTMESPSIEIIEARLFQYELINHEKTPKHERASKQDKEILDANDYTPYLPKLLSSDPVCKYMGFKVNEIVKITRRDKSIAFRIVK